MTTQISSNNIQQATLEAISGGPKITNIQITNSSGTVLDDTAISLSGGYIKITGTGFASGAQVLVNNTPASSTTFTSDTVLNAQVGPQVAGTYIVYVVNTDGGVAIAVNGLTYSSEPIWVTGSTLPTQQSNVAISVQLNATGATTYALASGSTLPAGLSLSSGGLLSGTISIETETTYSFIIDAIDNELQDSPRTFSLTVSVIVADPYFYLTTLLLPGNGDNNATNNTFVDSSTNNFTVTRVGNSTQGNYSPFSQTGWSNFFDGTGDYLTTPSDAALALGTGDFTVECWVNATSTPNDVGIFESRTDGLGTTENGFTLTAYSSSVIRIYSNGVLISSSGTTYINAWCHVAVVRASGVWTLYVNGISQGTNSAVRNMTNTDAVIGAGRYNANSTPSAFFPGYISNLRIVKGTAVYTANFTPSTTPLTAIANTSLLTCQSNRFIDNSTNNFTVTRNGDVRIEAFSPFNPTIAYSAAVVGGSGYFDGNGDYLTTVVSAANDLSSGDFTIESWIFPTSNAQTTSILQQGEANWRITRSTNETIEFLTQGAARINSTNITPLNSWSHIAVCKVGSTMTMYINGVAQATTTTVSPASQTVAITVGTNPASVGNVWYFVGYMSNIRIVKGTAVYTTNFTPPTAPLTAIANTSLLLNFTNGPIADATSKNVVETLGDAKISTAVSKFGGSSMYFDGTGDRLDIPSSPLFNFGTDNFTIECWIYASSMTGWRYILSQGGASNNWLLALNGTTFYVSIYSGVNTTYASSMNINQWYHLAVTCSNGTTRLFLDGTLLGSSNDSLPFAAGRTLRIGANPTNAEFWNGYMQDLRITKGLARYTTTFTPPTAAFPIQ